MSDAMQELERKLRQTETALRRQITENKKIKDDEKTRITTLNQKLRQSQKTSDDLKKKNKELQENHDWWKKMEEDMHGNFVDEHNQRLHYEKMFATWVIAFRNLNNKLSKSDKHSEPPLLKEEESIVSSWEPYIENIEMYLFQENPFIIKQS